jgi:hypothetical protein
VKAANHLPGWLLLLLLLALTAQIAAAPNLQCKHGGRSQLSENESQNHSAESWYSSALKRNMHTQSWPLQAPCMNNSTPYRAVQQLHEALLGIHPTNGAQHSSD